MLEGEREEGKEIVGETGGGAQPKEEEEDEEEQEEGEENSPFKPFTLPGEWVTRADTLHELKSASEVISGGSDPYL